MATPPDETKPDRPDRSLAEQPVAQAEADGLSLGRRVGCSWIGTTL